ncbi:MAG: AtpZ/AtpI family protein [Bacillota bacterium]
MNDKKFIIKLLAIATNFIYEAFAAILVGYLIGRGLDYLLSFDNVFIIIFMVLGALTAIRNLMVRVYRLGAKDDD